MPRQAAFVLCALLVGSLGDEATETKKTKKKKRASKDWSKVDLDAVGREWESGDEADELKAVELVVGAGVGPTHVAAADDEDALGIHAAFIPRAALRSQGRSRRVSAALGRPCWTR